MLQKIELTLEFRGGKNAGSFPIDCVTMFSSVFSWSTLDVSSGAVSMAIEAHASFMFFDSLYEGSAGLTYVELVAVPARNFIDKIFETGRGSG